MKRAIVAIVVLLACGKSNELPLESWGVAEYAKAGIQLDKPWTAAEHVQAASVLKDVTAGHRDRLPRFRGAKSGAVFAQLIADLPADETQPIADRFAAHGQRYDATNQISKLYMENALAPPTRDWIELIGALLRESVILSTSADVFLASLPADDPSREVRLQGLAKMKAGYGMMLHGAFLVAGNLQVPEADRVVLVEHATVALPVLFPAAPAETQQNIRDHITKLIAALPEGKLRAAVTAAQRALP